MFQNSDGKPLIGRIKLRWKKKHLRFSTIVDAYLGKGTRYTDSYYGCINRKCVTLEWWPWMTLSDPEKWVTRGPISVRTLLGTIEPTATNFCRWNHVGRGVGRSAMPPSQWCVIPTLPKSFWDPYLLIYAHTYAQTVWLRPLLSVCDS